MATPPQPDLPGITANQTASAGETVTSGRRPRSASGDLQIAMGHARALVEGLRGEMRGEITALTAAVRESDTKRSADIDKLTHSLSSVPKLDDIRKENRQTVAWAVGIVLALIIGLYTVFGVGANTTSGFADRVLGVKEQQKVEQQRYDQLNAKIDQALKERAHGQANGNAIQPTPESNVVGNRT